MGVFNFFQKKGPPPANLKIDIHSHLLPGIDDGAQTMEDSMALINAFIEMGYEKLITTPHIMPEFYPNDADIIQAKLSQVKAEVQARGIAITIEAAAEYYLDEDLLSKIANGDNLLTFGDNYLLFETPFLNEPAILKEFIFQALSAGYKPVMAHPERYSYLLGNDDYIEELRERGTLFQINAISLNGFYSKPVRNLAIKIVNWGFADFVGSDCHNMAQLQFFRDNRTKFLEKAIASDLINNKL